MLGLRVLETTLLGEKGTLTQDINCITKKGKAVVTKHLDLQGMTDIIQLMIPLEVQRVWTISWTAEPAPHIERVR